MIFRVKTPVFIITNNDGESEAQSKLPRKQKIRICLSEDKTVGVSHVQIVLSK
jgi:hypothetical protein